MTTQEALNELTKMANNMKRVPPRFDRTVINRDDGDESPVTAKPKAPPPAPTKAVAPPPPPKKAPPKPVKVGGLENTEHGKVQLPPDPPKVEPEEPVRHRFGIRTYLT